MSGRRVCSGLAVLACAASLACTRGAGGDAPLLVLVVIDTLRADALSCYGNERPTTPELDALARGGVLFEDVLAHAPNTVPSHASLFTGLSPWAHAAANLEHPERGPAALDDRFETLAERLAAAGWQTAAFTDGAKLGPGWNLLQGFEHVESDTAGVAAKVDQALEFLAHRRDGRPLLVFLHTYQVHLPYTAPGELARRFDPDYEGVLSAPDREIRAAWNERGELPQVDLLERQAEFTARDVEHLVALYHGELAYTDRELGRLLDAVGPGGSLGEATLVVTADHGEEFGEHGQIGHRQLFRETLHVPLLVHLPGKAGRALAGRRVATRVGVLDVHSLLLSLAGQEPEAGTLDLLDLARGGDRPARVHFAERNERLHLGPECPLDRAVRLGSRALLERHEGEGVRRRLHDLELDPDEATPLEGRDPALEARLEEHFQAAARLRDGVLSGDLPDPGAALDGSSRRELRALGYGAGGDSSRSARQD